MTVGPCVLGTDGYWVSLARSRHGQMVPFGLDTSTKLLYHSNITVTPKGWLFVAPEVTLILS